MSEKNNDQKLATSRLLDLLRAQQVGPSEPDDDSSRRRSSKKSDADTDLESKPKKSVSAETEIETDDSKDAKSKKAETAVAKSTLDKKDSTDTDQPDKQEAAESTSKTSDKKPSDDSSLDSEPPKAEKKSESTVTPDSDNLKKRLEFLTSEFSKAAEARPVDSESQKETVPPTEDISIPASEPEPEPQPEPQPQPVSEPEPETTQLQSKIEAEPAPESKPPVQEELPSAAEPQIQESAKQEIPPQIDDQADNVAPSVEELQPPPSKGQAGANQAKLMNLLNVLESKTDETASQPQGEPELSVDDVLGTQPIGAPVKEPVPVEEPVAAEVEEQLPSEPDAEVEAPKKARGARNLLERRKKYIEAEKSEKATEAIRTQIVEETQQRSTSLEIEVDDEGWAVPMGFGPDMFEMAESLAPSLQADQFTVNLMRRIMKSSHRICLEVDDHGIRYLEAKMAGSGFTIQKYGRLELPYKMDDATTIKDIRTLVEVALPKIFDKSTRNKSYVSVYSNQFQGKTHFFLAPPGLGKKDLGELINWQAQKNMNLGEGRGILRFFAQSSPTSGGKDHVVILGSDKEMTKQALTFYKKSGFKIRYTTQLPAILWYAFKREYPDQVNRTVILLHMEQTKTTLVVVHQGVLLSTREMAVGIDDFEAALEQKINIDGKPLTLSRPEARKIFFDFGIPKNPVGKIKPHGLTLYRVSIFLRPVIERLTSEIQRSINFFKKQYNELNWDHIYISGLGGAVPNLPRALKENLGIEIGLFNPVRAENVTYTDEDHPIPFDEFPNYVTLFSMLSIHDNDYNLLPQELVLDQQLIPYASVAGLAALVVIPIILLSLSMEQIRANDLAQELETKEAPLKNMSPKTEQYLGFQKDIRILNQYEGFLETDSLKSENYIKVLKFLSHIVPVEIKLTKLTIDKDLKGGMIVSDSTNTGGITEGDAYRDFVLLDGFVESDRSVSDIQLTNFKMKVEKAGFFKKVKMVIKARDDKEGNRRFFEMDCEF